MRQYMRLVGGRYRSTSLTILLCQRSDTRHYEHVNCCFYFLVCYGRSTGTRWYNLSIFLANVKYVVVRPSVYRLSVVCLSVTFMHPTQEIEIFGNVSTPFNTLAICRHPSKILRRSSQGNPAEGRVKHKKVIAKCSDFGPFRGYISETVQDMR